MIPAIAIAIIAFTSLPGCYQATHQTASESVSLWQYAIPSTAVQQCRKTCKKSMQDQVQECVKIHADCGIRVVAGGIKSYVKGDFSGDLSSQPIAYVDNVSDPLLLRRTGACSQRVDTCQQKARYQYESCEKDCGI